MRPSSSTTRASSASSRSTSRRPRGALLEEARERAIDELERIEEETGEKQHTLIVDDELDLDWEQVPDDLVDKSDATPTTSAESPR
jgi:hypothetical protein